VRAVAGLRTLTEGIALRLLARDGIAAIWHLQMAAAAGTELATRLARTPF